MRIWKQRKEQVPALLFIVSMSPPGYPSAWLRPRRARFRFARQDHCSSATSIGLNSRMRRQQEFSLTNFGRERNRLIATFEMNSSAPGVHLRVSMSKVGRGSALKPLGGVVRTMKG
jgi:hypothetical protein